MSVEIVVTPPHALVNTDVDIVATFYSGGVLVDPGATTVAVSDLTGAVVVAAGAATTGSGTSRTYTLAAHTQLDILTVTWTSATYGDFTSTLEIVGGFLFSLIDARAYDGRALQSATTYTADALEEARARITDEFEVICGVSFVRRVKQVYLDGDYSFVLDLPDTRVSALRSVETRLAGAATWTAYTTPQLNDLLLDDFGRITQETQGRWTVGRRNVRATYEHGYATPPGPIKQAALTVLRYQFASEILSQRTISLSSEYGTTQFATANVQRGWHYGLPQVDAVLVRYAERTAIIA